MGSASYSDVGQAHVVGSGGRWLAPPSYVIRDLPAVTSATYSNVGQALLSAQVAGGLLLYLAAFRCDLAVVLLLLVAHGSLRQAHVVVLVLGSLLLLRGDP